MATLISASRAEMKEWRGKRMVRQKKTHTHRIVKKNDGGEDRKMKDTKMEGKRALDRWIEAKIVWIL